MARKTLNNVKLGLFVIGGLGFLIMVLYVIGKNQNLFGNTFLLKARFENVQGLMPGNNIRFAGIQAGTVKSVQVLNDSTIEVSLLVKTSMKKFIRKNSIVSIGTDGLVGNKLLNIQTGKSGAPTVDEGDILYSSPGIDTDQILKVLSNTNNDIAVIATELKQTVQRINASTAIWTVLNDETLPTNLRQSLVTVRSASEKMNSTMANLYAIVEDVKNGKGSVGTLLTDTAIAVSLKDAIATINGVGVKADTITSQITALVADISREINNGKGTVNTLLKDEGMALHLNNSIKNIEQGTLAFNQNMEALKHNFLFRGYFRKLEARNKIHSAKN